MDAIERDLKELRAIADRCREHIDNQEVRWVYRMLMGQIRRLEAKQEGRPRRDD